MRTYLYLWKTQDQLVASGIHFADLLPLLEGAGGLVLLRHDYVAAAHDPASGFDYVEREGFSALAAADIYSFGDFVWGDYPASGLPCLAPDDVAQLLYFAHARVPLRQTSLASLGNRFLVAAHDDGWWLSLHTEQWDPVRTLLADLVARLTGSSGTTTIETRLRDDRALWITASGVEDCEGTTDIDVLLNARILQ